MTMPAPLTRPIDKRAVKAFEIAADAGQWLRCRTRDGRKFFGIPSQANPNRIYFVTRDACTCPDAARSPMLLCKHALAVRLHCAAVRAHRQQSPALAIAA